MLIILFTFTINFTSFHLREYLDIRTKITSLKKLEIKKGMSKEKLEKLCKEANTTELESKIMMMFYCERKSITYIAIKLSYSYDRIWQLKNDALKKIKKLVD